MLLKLHVTEVEFRPPKASAEGVQSPPQQRKGTTTGPQAPPHAKGGGGGKWGRIPWGGGGGVAGA